MLNLNGMNAAIGDAIREAKREMEYADLAGVDLAEECGIAPYDQIEESLTLAIQRVRTLRDHCHEWGANDICTVCGADGRA